MTTHWRSGQITYLLGRSREFESWPSVYFAAKQIRRSAQGFPLVVRQSHIHSFISAAHPGSIRPLNHWDIPIDWCSRHDALVSRIRSGFDSQDVLIVNHTIGGAVVMPPASRLEVAGSNPIRFNYNRSIIQWVAVAYSMRSQLREIWV